MSEELTPYKPKNLPEDMILFAELRRQGSKATSKHLVKAKKGTYPETGTAAKCSFWWNGLKEGKKKVKMAMVIMASYYNRVLKQLDQRQGQVLELTARTESQEEKIKGLNLKLLQLENGQLLKLKARTHSQEEKIELLYLQLLQLEKENQQLICKMSKLEFKAHNQKEEITSLKLRLQNQKAEMERLRDEIDDYNSSSDGSENSLRILVPGTSSASMQKSSCILLIELPELQYDNSNYEFWAKIKSWVQKGDVDPRCIGNLVREKCPPKAWQKVEEQFDNRALIQMAISNHAMIGRLLEKLWKCVSEALGPGTNMFELYYNRTQQEGETFEEYFEEKFKLYCSYGVDNREPDKNDRHFLCNVMEKAAKRYQRSFVLMSPKSSTDLLRQSMLIDRRLTTAEWNNECVNCKIGGHTITHCRKPGEDAKVGPNQCFTCGRYGHHSWNCWIRNR
ncbi:uncharacterized protein Hap1MRO34_025827 [Clarias gariepinus]|uniref:uncharacterized protein LOC128511878 n=1 Tax=Clarias gariepinus TaxID=13013 RepID=UPI00234CFABB|nr:uncharacterized protein LOC128511878 [Clarias gariepinus]